MGLAPQCCVDFDNKNEQTVPRRGHPTPSRLVRWRRRGTRCALAAGVRRHPAPGAPADCRRTRRSYAAGHGAGQRGVHPACRERVFEWQRREQFLSLAAQIMRRVLVDYARQRGAQRRGDGAKKLSIHDTQAALEVDEVQALKSFDDESVDVLAIDSALTRLHRSTRRRAVSSSCATSAA